MALGLGIIYETCSHCGKEHFDGKGYSARSAADNCCWSEKWKEKYEQEKQWEEYRRQEEYHRNNPYLTSCRLCGGKVSSIASACPHCGHPKR